MISGDGKDRNEEENNYEVRARQDYNRRDLDLPPFSCQPTDRMHVRQGLSMFFDEGLFRSRGITTMRLPTPLPAPHFVLSEVQSTLFSIHNRKKNQRKRERQKRKMK